MLRIRVRPLNQYCSGKADVLIQVRYVRLRLQAVIWRQINLLEGSGRQRRMPRKNLTTRSDKKQKAMAAGHRTENCENAQTQ